MKQEHIKSYYTINGLCLFIVCVILTSDLPQVRYTSTHVEGGRSSLKTGSADPPAILFASPVVRIDNTSILHPYFLHKSDAGPVRLMTIAHAFNYRMAVLRNGIKSAVRVARARKAEVCFLLNSDIQWGQQVAAMFQILSTMVVELPSF